MSAPARSVNRRIPGHTSEALEGARQTALFTVAESGAAPLPCMHPCLLAARPVSTAAGWTRLATSCQRAPSLSPSATLRWSTCFHADEAALRCCRYEQMIGYTSPHPPLCVALGCGAECFCAFQYASAFSACRKCSTHPLFSGARSGVEPGCCSMARLSCARRPPAGDDCDPARRA